jgi:peptide subunit release factor 1 (eRF1)
MQEKDNDHDKNVQQWKVKKLIKNLELCRGNGTSMISLILPPKDQISRAVKMLADEYGTASNIKSRVNRLSVLSAITSAQQRLKLFTRVPDNGLIIYWFFIFNKVELSLLTKEKKKKSILTLNHSNQSTTRFTCATTNFILKPCRPFWRTKLNLVLLSWMVMAPCLALLLAVPGKFCTRFSFFN